MIQEKVRELIESKLNDNTASKQFVVGQYAYLEDKDADFLYSIKSGYTLIEKNFIPVMMTFSGDYQPLPDQINGTATIGLDFLIKAEDIDKIQDDLNILDEFVPKIIANYENIVDGEITYKSVWNMDTLLPAGMTKPINGTYYTRITTTIYLDFSDTNTYGNSYTYELNGERLTLYDGNVDREGEENTPHRMGDYEALGGIDETSWKVTFQTYLDDNLLEISNSISKNDFDYNKAYTFAEKYDGIVNATFPVQILSISRPIRLGEKQYITLTLIKSDRDVE